MPPKTPNKTPRKPKDTPRRNRTRSTTGKDELEHTDDPEKIGENKKRKRKQPKEVPGDNTDPVIPRENTDPVVPRENTDPVEPPNEEEEEVEEEEVEEAVQEEELEPVPDNTGMVLPTGEWYMPDLNNTTLTKVLKEGRDYTANNEGKMLYRFEKLEQYTGYDYYLICPFTGKIDLFDTNHETPITINIHASKDPKQNSVVIEEVKKAMQEHNQRLWDNKIIPGEDLPVAPVDTPLTITQLAKVMTTYENLCKIQGELNLDLHNIRLCNRNDKWFEIGFRNTASNKIKGRLDTIKTIIMNDNIIRTSLGKHNYSTPTFDPCTSIITSTEALDRFNTLVNDICLDTINTATTVPTRPTEPVIPPVEEVSTPTNTGNIKPLEPRKVAFTEPTQDIQQRLTQLSVETEPINLLGRMGCPTKTSQGPVPSPNSVSSIGQQTNRGNFFMSRVVCYRCNEKGHLRDHCNKQVYCNFCSRSTHSTEACGSKPGGRTSSTPKFQTERDETDSTHSYTTNPAEESRLEILMKSQIDQTKNIEEKKERLNKIKEFEGSNKTRCVTWIVHNQTAAKALKIPLREALLKTSTGDMYEVISMTDKHQLETVVISYVLENFSDISTREDAEIKLRTIRRGPNKPLLTYNVKYAAIHRVAMECEPIDQKIESTWRNYANTLERDLAGKLNKDIGNHKGRWINNLQEVMNRARDVEFKERTNKVYRNRKDEDDATQIKEVNELDYDCYEEVNQMQNFQPRFNSTMKQQNNSHGAQSSGYQS